VPTSKGSEKRGQGMREEGRERKEWDEAFW